MNTFYKLIVVTLLFLINQATYVGAQICTDVTVILEPDGTYVLDPDQILNVVLQPDQTAFVIPAFFNCENVLQPTLVSVYIVENGETNHFCDQQVTVLDNTPPVAGCKSTLHVQLGENGAYRFLYDTVNDNSYDLCTEIGSTLFIPDRITCTDPNPMDVQMIVHDLAGNADTCTVSVSYDNYAGPTDPIQCVDSLSYFFDAQVAGDGLFITPDIVLEMGIHGCIDNYAIDIYNGLLLQPDDFIGLDDTSSVILAVLTELESGLQCTTAIDVGVFYHDMCEVYLTTMCDTVCKSEPVGDCSTGHSNDDLVEWPCDVYITDWCVSSDLYPYPENIEWYGYPASSNAWPSSNNQFIRPQDNFGPLFIGYFDVVNNLPTGQEIIRTWVLLNWCTQQTLDYVQTIFVDYDLTYICDTLPWNTPAGDCTSGHTFLDDVEWPADITVHSLFSNPDDLALNPEVEPENARPRLTQSCFGNTVSYQDFEAEINDTTLRIERTWYVIDFTSGEVWEYVQVLTIIHDGLQSTVCVVLEDDFPVEGVELLPGVYTDDNGCRQFPDPEGVIVSPAKESPFEEGVNILDFIMMLEGLLDIKPLSIYQQIGADLNNSQGLTTLDMIVFKKFLHRDFTPLWTHAWKFYEETTNQDSADISDPLTTYKFIGAKMGDLDNSYTKGLNLDDIVLHTEDQVLNAGEMYAIPFYLERNENLVGFAIQLKNENDNLEFLNVTAPNLGEFSYDEDVILESNGVTIQWVSPLQDLINGIALDTTQALFILHVRANENIILNEHLTLEATFDNVLKPADPASPFHIRLSWEDVVVNSIVHLDNGRRIEMFPNPVTDMLYLKGIGSYEQGKVIIMDPAGRIVFEEILHPSLDVSSLQQGMYYVVFMMDGQKSIPVPVLKL